MMLKIQGVPIDLLLAPCDNIVGHHQPDAGTNQKTEPVDIKERIHPRDVSQKISQGKLISKGAAAGKHLPSAR